MNIEQLYRKQETNPIIKVVRPGYVSEAFKFSSINSALDYSKKWNIARMIELRGKSYNNRYEPSYVMVYNKETDQYDRIDPDPVLDKEIEDKIKQIEFNKQEARRSADIERERQDNLNQKLTFLLKENAELKEQNKNQAETINKIIYGSK